MIQMTPTLAFVFPGGTELLIILFVVVLLFGAKKLPELAKGIGRSMGEFKKAREDFNTEVSEGEKEGAAEEKKPEPASGGGNSKDSKGSKDFKDEIE